MGLGYEVKLEEARKYLLDVVASAKKYKSTGALVGIRNVIVDVQRELYEQPASGVHPKAYREMLKLYYPAQKSCISEHSGNIREDLRDLMEKVQYLSWAHLGEHFDFGDDPEIYDIDVEDIQRRMKFGENSRERHQNPF